jgi:predicted aconitase
MVQLTGEERAMLSGEQGPAVQKAMGIVHALATIYEAEHLLPAASAQIAGVSYKNLGQAGLCFLEDWAAQGARVRIPAFMNPAGMDLERWREMGIDERFARQQQRVVDALAAMGVAETCTCTPYLAGYIPQAGEHLAWSESSAVSYANSVLGGRSNREGGPSALASAITGRTAAYGLHLNRNRTATHRVTVGCRLRNEADFGALGYWAGQQVGDGVPFFRLEGGATMGRPPTQEQLMALGAAMAASGAVALYYVEGVTPEAALVSAEVDSLPALEINDLSAAYDALNHPLNEVDFVSLGCPHSTVADLERVAGLLEGQQVRATLWITTSRHVRREAQDRGLVQQVEAAGGHVFADTCLVVAPIEALGFRSMATNSAKAAFYSPSHSGLQRRFGTLEQCIRAALSSRWDTGGNSG